VFFCKDYLAARSPATAVAVISVPGQEIPSRIPFSGLSVYSRGVQNAAASMFGDQQAGNDLNLWHRGDTR